MRLVSIHLLCFVLVLPRVRILMHNILLELLIVGYDVSFLCTYSFNALKWSYWTFSLLVLVDDNVVRFHIWCELASIINRSENDLGHFRIFWGRIAKTAAGLDGSGEIPVWVNLYPSQLITDLAMSCFCKLMRKISPFNFCKHFIV